MGWHVEWSDKERAYVVTGFISGTVAACGTLAILRTVNEVEAYVTAHASGRW